MRQNEEAAEVGAAYAGGVIVMDVNVTAKAPTSTAGDGGIVAARTAWGIQGFRFLYGAQAVSQVGTQISVVAVPLVAVLSLNASPLDVGALVMAQTLAPLFIALPAGVWVDRLPRRPLMVTADVVRCVLLASIPTAAFFDSLTLWQLYLVAMFSGVATVFFDISYQSYLPALVGRTHLVEANTRIEGVGLMARLGGPATAGWLVQVITAPVTVLVDAASYLGSALLLSGARTDEPPRARRERSGLWTGMWKGLRFVAGHPALRVIALCTAVSNLFGAVVVAVAVLFAIRVLHLGPAGVGLVGSMSAAGGLLGVHSARRLVRRLGAARMVRLSVAVTSPFALLLPLAAPGWRVCLWFVGWFLVSFGQVLYNIAQISFRQTVTPDAVLGRMNATMRFLVGGGIPLGALVGGLLGETLGLRYTILIGGVGGLLAIVPLWWLRQPPAVGGTVTAGPGSAREARLIMRSRTAQDFI